MNPVQKFFILISASITIANACPIELIYVDTKNDISTIKALETFTDCFGNKHDKGDKFKVENSKNNLETMYNAGASDVEEEIVNYYEENAPEKTCKIDPNTTCG